MLGCLWMRLKIEDTPDFNNMKSEGRLSKAPIKELLTQYPASLCKLFMAEARRVDGMILGDVHLTEDTLDILGKLQFPFVTVLRYAGEYPSITVDDCDGGRQAAQHLFERGHRNVGVLAGQNYTSTGRDRTKGFVDFYSDAGFPIPPDRIMHSHVSAEEGHQCAQHLLSSFPDITAIYATNDFAAIGAMGTANLFGFIITAEQLPQQLAQLILGFTSNQYVFMLIVMIVLLILGTFMDNVGALVLFVPTMITVVQQLNINMVYFGVFTIIALAVGQFTPPVGLNLFIACNISKEKLETVVKDVLPYLLVYIAMGGHKAYGFAKVAAEKECWLISRFNKKDTECLFAKKAEVVQDAVDAAFARHGAYASCVYMPEGSVSLPVPKQ